MYVRKKTIKRTSRKSPSFRDDYPADQETYTYYQLVRGYRNEEGKVRQEVLAHLGRHETPEAAIEDLEHRARICRERAADYQHAAEYVRRDLAGPVPLYSTKQLVPRAGTPFETERPSHGGFAPSGWFYSSGNDRVFDYLARREIEEAEGYETRAERIRSLL
jgi:hypothetical protein